nr:reverse transcriptase domain-containing protein [Tanacetum cinerariifolium]
MTGTDKGVVYLNKHNLRSLMKLNEVHKFCDGTLMKIQENLIDMVNKNKLGRGNARKRLRDLIKENVDVFAWTYADIMGIPRTIMVAGKPFNMLNEFKHIEPVKKKKRNLAPEHNEAIHKEVEELMKVSILREVKYQTWVSNPVVVKKDDERWSVFKKGRVLSVPFERNRRRAANVSLRICIFLIVLGGCRLETTFTFEGFALISWIELHVNFSELFKENSLIENRGRGGIQTINRLIETLPMVTASIKGEALVMYLAASKESIGAVLLAERGKKQGQILADFLAETPSMEYKEMEAEKTIDEELVPENTWKLYINGASSSDGSKAGLMLVSPNSKKYTYAFRFEFETTNNEAEYEVLLAGLRITAKIKIQDLAIFVDS